MGKTEFTASANVRVTVEVMPPLSPQLPRPTHAGLQSHSWRLNIACKRILGVEEWECRVEIAWESLRDLEVVTADMLESAILDGFGHGVYFDREEAQKLRALAEYCMRGYMGPHHATIMMLRRKVPR